MPVAHIRRTVAVALAAALALSSCHSLHGQTLDPTQLAERLRTGIAAADIAGDTDGLEQAVVLGRRAVTAFPDDALVNHYMGYALYRLAGPMMGSDRDGATALLEEAESFLDRSIEIEPIPESHALLASALGMRVGGPLSAMSLGMRSGAAMGRAKELGPGNPRVRLMEGISAFHTPAMLGGGQDAALEHFLLAIELFADDPSEPPLPAWGHAEAHAWLGQAYAALGRVEEARAAYERALEIEPGYAWVRAVLLPALAG